jgi:hypothetical protein
MPLLDHFRPPLSERRHWHSFHHAWATVLSFRLNALLPSGYFAEANVQFGIEIDVAALEAPGVTPTPAGWAPPPPRAELPLELAGPVVEIHVFGQSGGPTLAGAVELVSPSNKDRPSSREAFVSKCAGYIRAGVGLVVVDVVTERPADFHRDLLQRVGAGDPGPGPELGAYAYRAVDREGTPGLDVWAEPVALGAPLPTLPLWLRGGLCLPIDFESTYLQTCAEYRIQPAA